MQCVLPSLLVLSPGDEVNQNDDLKCLVNNIIRCMKPGQDVATDKKLLMGYANTELLDNFSRRLVFSSGDRHVSSDSSYWNDVSTSKCMLHELKFKLLTYL